MATTPDSITTALAPSRQAFFHSIWQEHWPKLNINGAAKVHTLDVELAETLLSWLKDSNHDLPYSITISSTSAEKSIDPTLAKIANIQVVPTLPDDAFTHALAHIGVYRREQTLPILKSIFYSLIPKGIAVVSVTKRNPIDEILRSVLQTSGRRSSSSGTNEVASEPQLRELAEAAQFELGKVRVAEKSILVTGEELKRLRSEVQVIMDAAFGQQGDGQSWESIFDAAWNREVESNGGMKVECWVLLAMKWDLLCA